MVAIRKSSDGKLSDAGNFPVGPGESSFSKQHWGKLGKESDVKKALDVKSDIRKKVKA
jgi:hypothetical protein